MCVCARARACVCVCVCVSVRERVCVSLCVRACVLACALMCMSVRARASLGKLSNMQRGGLITRRFEAVAVYQSTTWNIYHSRFRLSPREEQGA